MLQIALFAIDVIKHENVAEMLNTHCHHEQHWKKKKHMPLSWSQVWRLPLRSSPIKSMDAAWKLATNAKKTHIQHRWHAFVYEIASLTNCKTTFVSVRRQRSDAFFSSTGLTTVTRLSFAWKGKDKEIGALSANQNQPQSLLCLRYIQMTAAQNHDVA